MSVECAVTRNRTKEASNELRRLEEPELQEKLKACESPKDILDLAAKEGYELSSEELEAVAGGWVGRCRDFEFPKQ